LDLNLISQNDVVGWIMDYKNSISPNSRKNSDSLSKAKHIQEESQDFPWLCAVESCTDLEGDEWHVRVDCTGMQPTTQPSQTGKVDALYLVSAFCTISSKNLQKMGFSPSRMSHVVGIESKHLRLETTINAMCKVEDVQKTGVQMAAKSKANFSNKYTHQEKKELLWKRIQRKTFSNFEAEEDAVGKEIPGNADKRV
jgi:hypothetical protein